MEFKAVIFDLDGTLLDTLDDIADAANRGLEAAGLPVHSVDSYRYFVGDGLLGLIQRILPADKRDEEHVRRLIMAFREDYARNWQVKTGLYDGIAPLLNTLQEKSIKLSVLSNKPHEFTVVCVQHFLKDWTFQVVLGHREGCPRKPDPSGGFEIADRLAVRPEEILYLGDTATDMQTAHAAGMLPVGALWGFRTEKELLDSGAQHLVSHPLEVLDLFSGNE